jgi:hypothetical protein
MNRVIAFLSACCLAGCVSSSGAPRPTASSKPAMCHAYVGGRAACIGSCNAGAVPTGASAAMCPPVCTPGNPGEPTTCSPTPACEAAAHAQEAAQHAQAMSCVASCNAIPVQCW